MKSTRQLVTVLVIRIAFGVFILTEVWLHAHWSVGLAITLLLIAAEVESLTTMIKEKP